jgi:Holliday junction resolvase-like predicted endonuclease
MLEDRSRQIVHDEVTEMATYKSSASTRHAKITGDFAEALVLYWLSRDGFECARVDHTGIDLIARNPREDDEVMGISVKSRSRLRENSGGESVSIPLDNFEKAEAACKAFDCRPYFAVVVDDTHSRTIRAFITSKKHLLEKSPPRKTGSFWKMGERDLKDYSDDREIKAFSLSY